MTPGSRPVQVWRPAISAPGHARVTPRHGANRVIRLPARIAGEYPPKTSGAGRTGEGKEAANRAGNEDGPPAHANRSGWPAREHAGSPVPMVPGPSCCPDHSPERSMPFAFVRR
jgi:hypothetical protein